MNTQKKIIAAVVGLSIVVGAFFVFKKKDFVDVADLKIEDIQVGSGTEALLGKNVTVHYTGWLTDGKKFDSSYDHQSPFTFPLGAGRVIQGWEKGVVGMKVGGKRRLNIPSSLGYGTTGVGGIIPPNATLVFEIELLNVN
jgi:FKBP-type peptidyl-prolyl cis-trans isomerase FkpA